MAHMCMSLVGSCSTIPGYGMVAGAHNMVVPTRMHICQSCLLQNVCVF
jgi:hypothetical protein